MQSLFSDLFTFNFVPGNSGKHVFVCVFFISGQMMLSPSKIPDSNCKTWSTEGNLHEHGGRGVNSLGKLACAEVINVLQSDQSEKPTFLQDKRPQPQKRMWHNNENVTLARGIETKPWQPVCWLEECKKSSREGQWRGENEGCRSTVHPAPPALSADWRSDKYAWVWLRQWRPLMVRLRVLYLWSK